MFFYQGAKQNKGLKALVTRENVRKLMLDVNVVIFSNICHSISSLEAEAFWTVSVWMIFFVKWSRQILNEFSEDTGNHRRFYSQSGSGSLTTWEWPIFFKSNNKDGNVTCSPERPIKGSICSDPYIYIYIYTLLDIAVITFVINSVTHPQLLAQGTQILSAPLLLNHCCSILSPMLRLAVACGLTAGLLLRACASSKGEPAPTFLHFDVKI